MACESHFVRENNFYACENNSKKTNLELWLDMYFL